jgi:hypothetical protein
MKKRKTSPKNSARSRIPETKSISRPPLSKLKKRP